MKFRTSDYFGIMFRHVVVIFPVLLALDLLGAYLVFWVSAEFFGFSPWPLSIAMAFAAILALLVLEAWWLGRIMDLTGPSKAQLRVQQPERLGYVMDSTEDKEASMKFRTNSYFWVMLLHVVVIWPIFFILGSWVGYHIFQVFEERPLSLVLVIPLVQVLPVLGAFWLGKTIVAPARWYRRYLPFYGYPAFCMLLALLFFFLDRLGSSFSISILSVFFIVMARITTLGAPALSAAFAWGRWQASKSRVDRTVAVLATMATLAVAIWVSMDVLDSLWRAADAAAHPHDGGGNVCQVHIARRLCACPCRTSADTETCLALIRENLNQYNYALSAMLALVVLGIAAYMAWIVREAHKAHDQNSASSRIASDSSPRASGPSQQHGE